MSNGTVSRLHNRTRETSDFQYRFRKSFRFDLLALYRLLQTSDLAREGMLHSGSFRFADHIYRNQASGRTFLGCWLDRLLLDFPSTRAMRSRFIKARNAIFDTALASYRSERIEVLTVPCGIPRDYAEAIENLHRTHPNIAGQMWYTGLDLDPAAIEEGRILLGSQANVAFVQGDALDAQCFPINRFHCICSTGLGEFLTDEDLLTLYSNIYQSLARGGLFYTSALRAGRFAVLLMEKFELRATYRTQDQVRMLMGKLPWSELRFIEDRSGLQTYVYAWK
jgi:SAM-dependent methyltransferase